jgi:trehalose synthase
VLPDVPIAPRSLSEYAAEAGDDAIQRLRQAANPLRGCRLLNVNSTAFGGGVAELLNTHVPLLRDLGVHAGWAVIEGSDAFYSVTKSIHNGLQGAEVEWTSAMRETYWERLRANAEAWDEAFDVVMVHDPQPAGLLPLLEERGQRRGAWVWRCHIDLSATNPAVWSFFEPMVDRYDGAIFTMREFAQPGVEGPTTAFIPPSIDPTSMKNRELEATTVREIVSSYGIDPDRPIAAQVSRFDPWKDPLGVIDAFRIARGRVPGLQLVMAGSMASDDPEGLEFFERTEAHRDGDPDIHLLTNVQNVGNTEINAFQRAGDVVIQKSTREGFGLVVAEAMWKRTPVIGGNVGGIRLQIDDGVNGYLVDSVDECAARLVELLGDPQRRRLMGDRARDRVRERFLSTRELEEYLRLLAGLL